MVKLAAILSLIVAFSLITPQEAAANCTDNYISCIAEAGLKEEPFRTMQDAECIATYAGCVISRLRWW